MGSKNENDETETSKSKNNRLTTYASATSVGMEMGLAIGVGAGIGYWLDKRFGTQPYLVLLFTFFGIGAAFKALMREVNKFINKEKNQ